MPYQWHKNAETAPENSGAFSFANGDQPAQHLTVWPHRSLAPKGFVWFIGITFGLFLMPLSALLGTAALWGLLPFLMGTLAMIWYFLRRNQDDASLHEELMIWDDRVELTRINPRKADQHWDANPYWVDLELHTKGGPVDNYLTLRGNERTVEIGAFLSPDERQELYHSLLMRIR